MEKPKEKEPKPEKTDKIDGTIVYRLQLTQAFTVEGVTDSSLYEHKGWEMLYKADGVHCKYKNTSLIIPLSNVVHAVTTKNPTKR